MSHRNSVYLQKLHWHKKVSINVYILCNTRLRCQITTRIISFKLFFFSFNIFFFLVCLFFSAIKWVLLIISWSCLPQLGGFMLGLYPSVRNIGAISCEGMGNMWVSWLVIGQQSFFLVSYWLKLTPSSTVFLHWLHQVGWIEALLLCKGHHVDWLQYLV